MRPFVCEWVRSQAPQNDVDLLPCSDRLLGLLVTMRMHDYDYRLHLCKRNEEWNVAHRDFSLTPLVL